MWLGNTLRPYVGNRVLELGAGIGTITNQFIPRELYIASDTNLHYLHYLKSYSFGKPYLRVLEIDPENSQQFWGLEEQFDTVIAVNILQQVADEQAALKNMRDALEPGGRAIVLVPQHPKLYGSLDASLDRKKRYTARKLEQVMKEVGFRIEQLFDFNRVSVPGWWLNGKLLKRRKFSRVQLKALDMTLPLLKRVDRVWPWKGLSAIAIGVKE